jgi:lipopolysaccharide transport system ATP-binding protein
MSLAISANGLSKKYRLGLIGSQTMRDDLNRWWRRFRGREAQALGNGPANIEGNTLWALRDVSFDVKQGDAVGIIGRNGAGKSTLLKILSGITAPTTGVAKMKGRVASLLEVGAGFHPELSGRDNIYLNGAILGMKKADIRRRFDEIVAFSEIEKFIDTPVKHYSSGMYVRLAFAVAAHVDAEILLVDEALAVGDVLFQKKCVSRMTDLWKTGRTIFYVSHNLSSIQNLCNRAYLLDRGMLLDSGDTQSVIETYMKLTFDKASIPIECRTDRYGDGRIRFVGLHWERNGGQMVPALMSGEDYRLILSFRSNGSSRMRDVLVSIAIHDLMGHPHLLHQTDFTNSNFSFEAFEGKFICKIPKFPLAEGEYTINIYVGIGEATCDSLNDAARIVVERGNFFGTNHPGRPHLCKTLKECFWELESSL